jgi:hypothetical protein
MTDLATERDRILTVAPRSSWLPELLHTFPVLRTHYGGIVRK